MVEGHGAASCLTSLGCQKHTHGLVADAATLRANEVGIRLALGADRRHIILMFLAESAAVLTVALTVGVGVAIVAGRFAGSLLFGVRPYDVAPLTSAASLLTLAAVTATALSARRASWIDPATARRCE